MRVGYGVTALAKAHKTGGVDGIGIYTREIFDRLRTADDVRITPVSFGFESISDIGYSDGVVLHPVSMLVAVSMFSGLPFMGYSRLKGKLDLFHATDHRIPNFGRIPVVATIHDAIPFSHPESVSRKHRLLILPLLKHSARWAARVITISEYSKSEIVRYFGVEPDRIEVIHNGVDRRWFTPVAEDTRNEVRRRYGLEKEYIVFVGTLQSKKNIERLVDAYCSMAREFMDHHDLVIVGKAGWNCDALVQKLTRLQSKGIRWLQYFPGDDLETVVVKGAKCLAFPSLAEDFGFPLVEGFSAGVHVLAANASSIPEVAGDAAPLFDPCDVESIQMSLMKMLDDASLRSILTGKGAQRVRQFTWEAAAKQTLGVYRSVAGG